MDLPPEIGNLLMCEQHGGLRHIFVHEAGHAVMSVDLGLDCPSLIVHDVDTWLTALGSEVELGGVVPPDPDPTKWVPGNPLAALKFVWAGVIAERALLDHAMDAKTASKGDVDVWLKGMSEPNGFDLDRLPSLVGMTFPEVIAEVTDWADENKERIDVLARTLQPSSEMSRADIIALVG